MKLELNIGFYGHFDAVLKIHGVANFNGYLCEDCFRFYKNKNRHKCGGEVEKPKLNPIEIPNDSFKCPCCKLLFGKNEKHKCHIQSSEVKGATTDSIFYFDYEAQQIDVEVDVESLQLITDESLKPGPH